MKKRLIIIFGVLFLSLAIGWISYGLFGHQFIRAMYEGRMVGFLNRIIEGQAKYPLGYYLKIADGLFFGANIVFCIAILTFLLTLMSRRFVKNRFDQKKGLKLIPIVFIIGLLLRLAWLIYAQPVPWSDYEGYQDVAKGLLEYHQFGYPQASAYRFPLYPVFLSLLMMISPNIFWLSLCNVILSSILIILVYFLAMQLTGNNILISLSGALFCAINPTFIFFAPVLASEHLYSVLLFSGLLLLFQKTKPTIRIILSGVALGLAFLTRGEGIFFIPTFLIAGYLSMKKHKFIYIRLAFLILICVIVILPWYVRNLKIFGSGVGISTTGGYVFYMAHNKYGYGYRVVNYDPEFKGLNEIESHKQGLRLGFNYIIKSKKSEFFKSILKGTFGLYMPTGYALHSSLCLPICSPDTGYVEKQLTGKNLLKAISIWFYMLILLMALISAIFYRTLAVKTWVILTSIIFMNWFCNSVVFLGGERYRFVAEIVFCILAGITLYNAAGIDKDI